MKARLTCDYQNEQGETIGIYGDVLEAPRDVSVEELTRLVASGSASEIKPPTTDQ